jgi:nucleoid-associated protein YgaU
MFPRLLVVAVLAVFLWAVFVRSSGASGHEQSYVVRAQDTLWSIAASRYAGDPREGVWKLRERNHLADATIRPGQILVLP